MPSSRARSCAGRRRACATRRELYRLEVPLSGRCEEHGRLPPECGRVRRRGELRRGERRLSRRRLRAELGRVSRRRPGLRSRRELHGRERHVPGGCQEHGRLPPERGRVRRRRELRRGGRRLSRRCLRAELGRVSGVGRVCDLAENCTARARQCPADAKSTAVCRPSAGCVTSRELRRRDDECPPTASTELVRVRARPAV
jgi:hypothetical protein